MQKKIILKYLFIVLIFLISGFSFSQKKQHKLTQNTFQSGESLVYKLRYGMVVGGVGEISLDETTIRGIPIFHAKAIARSIGLVDKLFNVEDIFESYFDKKTGLPYKAIRNVHEGNYKFYNEVFFYHSDSSVYSKKSGVHKTPSNILDMVSTLFYLRKIDMAKLKPGDVIDFVTYFSDEVFPFDFRYRGKETISTHMGKIRCYRFDPVVEPGRIFKTEDDMTIWISDDKNYLPIRVRFDMLVGSLKCELDSYENLKYPMSFIK